MAASATGTRQSTVLVPEFRFTIDEEDPPFDEDDQDGVLGPDEEAAECEAALQKPPEKRTREDCQVLQRATAGVKFIKSMDDPGQHLELCRVMTLKKFASGAHIFDQGDKGHTFYIIYSGTVEVYVNDYKSGKEGIGTCVVKLSMGDAFGELALLGDGLRAATIVTTEPTRLLQIDKDAYDSACAKHHHEKIARRMGFLRTVFLFKDTDDKGLSDLAKVFTERKYEKNQVIIKQGESTDSMYFIVTGSCRVLKRMPLSNTLAVKLATSPNETRKIGAALAESQQRLGASSPRERRGSTGGTSPGAGASPRSSASSASFVQLPESPLLEIAELGPAQYFGETALLEASSHGKKKWPHSTSIVSMSRVELLVLSKYDFYHHIDESVQQTMRDYAAKFYMSEERIRSSIEKQHRWGEYKRQLTSAHGDH